MKYILPFIIAVAVLFACNSSDNASADTGEDSKTDTAENKIEDWVSLYNGKDFTGWHSYGKDSVGSAWKTEDSAIHLKPLQRNSWQSANGGDLVTDEEYGNFDLKLEWKISEAGNSGIFFYVHEDLTKFKNPNQSGLEMQINDDAHNENGMIEKQRAGDLVGLVPSSSAKFLKPAGEWNQSEIKSNRGKLDFFMNSHHVLSTTLWNDDWQDLVDDSKFKKIENYGTYKKGRIALQDHGEEVWFRNIMIKKL